MKLLLTGPPRCGKTTLVMRVVEEVRREGVRLSGFYTEEVRSGGERVGFDIVTLDGEVAPLSRKGTGRGPRVGSYRVDLPSLEGVAVPAMGNIEAEAIVVDEIGLMELKSPLFKEAVLKVLGDPRPFLATIRWKREPFCDGVKGRSDTEVLEVGPNDRDELVDTLASRLLEAVGRQRS